MSESKFLKIKCPRCHTLHTTFGKASQIVKCKKCNKMLIKPTGGKVKVKAPIQEVI